MNKAKNQLKIIGFSEQRCNTFFVYLEDFHDSKLKLDAYLSKTKNPHKISFFRSFYPRLILANKEIKAIPEKSKKSTELKFKAVPKQKKYHSMSQKEKCAMGRRIGEAAMEKANKNMIQKIEQPYINLEKYSPIVNAPCIGCNKQCIPESCTALDNYVLSPMK